MKLYRVVSTRKHTGQTVGEFETRKEACKAAHREIVSEGLNRLASDGLDRYDAIDDVTVWFEPRVEDIESGAEKDESEHILTLTIGYDVLTEKNYISSSGA